MLAVSQHYVTTRAADTKWLKDPAPACSLRTIFSAKMAFWAPALMATPHARQKLRRRIGVRGQVEFHLHRLDRLPRLQTEKSIDRADIVAGAHQACLQRLDVGKSQGRRRTAPMERRPPGHPAV